MTGTDFRDRRQSSPVVTCTSARDDSDPRVAPDIPATGNRSPRAVSELMPTPCTTQSPLVTSIPPAPVAAKVAPCVVSDPDVCATSMDPDARHTDNVAAAVFPPDSDTDTVAPAVADVATYRPKRTDPVSAPDDVVPDVVSMTFVHPEIVGRLTE